jgi:hypothetical protein
VTRADGGREGEPSAESIVNGIFGRCVTARGRVRALTLRLRPLGVGAMLNPRSKMEIPVKAAILFATPPLGKSVALAQTLQQALQAQKADALPLTSFYDTPVPLPPGRPGVLLTPSPLKSIRYRQESARSGFYIILGPQADRTWPHRASFLFLSERRLPVVGR